MQLPQVSVIMTVFNSRNFVRQTIDSVLSQDFPDFEFIIIDDASNDGSQEIIGSFRDERIIFFTNRNNIGQTKSLNAAIKLSRGKYIARIDNDDICLPKRLSLQVGFMQDNPDVAVVGSWVELIDDAGRRRGEKRYPLMPNFMHFLSLVLLDRPCIAHPTVMIRRGILEETGCYNEKYHICQDYDLWLRITQKHKIRNLPYPLVRYRLHRQSSSFKNKMLMKKEIRNIIYSYILVLAPEFDDTQRNALVDYLLGRKQSSAKNGRMILGLKNSFLKSISQTKRFYYKNNAQLNGITEFLYLPALFLTNPVLSARRFVCLYPRYGRWVASQKFLKACGRAVTARWERQ